MDSLALKWSVKEPAGVYHMRRGILKKNTVLSVKRLQHNVYSGLKII